MAKPLVITLSVLVLLGMALALGVWRLVHASHVRPDHLGWHADGFAPCPDMPNCVSSLASDPRHAVDPLRYDGSAEQAMSRLQAIVTEMPGTTVVTRSDAYFHAEIRSPGLGYVDDLELYADQANGVIHVKSGARVPYYDFQVNRQRVQALRKAWLSGQ